MKILATIVFLVGVVMVGFAQEAYVYKTDSICYPTIDDCPPNPYLSHNVQLRLQQFNTIYSREVNMGAPDFQSSIEIIKPDVYYSVQKLSKYFCKCLKKGRMERSNAEDKFITILDKCIVIAEKDTSPLEAELRAASNPMEIVGIFEKIVITN